MATQSDIDALAAMLGAAGQYDWSGLLGQVTLGKPDAGMPTLAGGEATGYVGGQPTVAEQGVMGNGEPSYSIPGFGNMTAGQANALTPEQKNAALRDWSGVVSPGVPWAFGTLSGDALNTAYSKMLGEIGSGAYKGYGQTQNATLANKENFTQQFGRLGDFGSGITANSPYTLGAQKQYMDAVLNAPKGAADAFSYMAKMPALTNMAGGALGDFLGGAIQNVSGQSLAQLRANPSYTNTDLANDLVASQTGQPVSTAGQNFLQRMLGIQPAPAAAQAAAAPGATQATGPGDTTPGSVFHQDRVGPDGRVVSAGQPYPGLGMAMPGAGSGAVPAAVNPADGGTTVFGGTHIHLPTGFGTSLQDYNALGSPGLQGATLDAVSAGGGESSPDFLAGMKQASGNFADSAYAK